jgi:hypothetical protein
MATTGTTLLKEVEYNFLQRVRHTFGERDERMKDRFLVLFTDKFMILWLFLAAAGVVTFRFHRAIGVVLCAPVVLFFAGAFVVLAIANRKQDQQEDQSPNKTSEHISEGRERPSENAQR